MASNPILTEIQNLSPAAKGALGMAGHAIPPPATPGAPAPGMLLPHPDSAEPAPLSLPYAGGQISLPEATPKLVTGPNRGQAILSSGEEPTQQEKDFAERGRLLSQGSGEDQIYSRVMGSRLGKAHPLLGRLLGGVGETLAKAGDIGLSAVAPEIAVNVPGTAYHHQALLNQADRAVGEDVGNAERQAETATEQAKAPLEEAQTENLEHPPSQVLQSPTGDVLVNPRGNGEAVPVTAGGQPVLPFRKPTLQRVTITGPNGQPMFADYDPETGITSVAGAPVANPVPYQKPPNEGPHPGTVNGRPTFGVYAPGKGWTDAGTGQPLTDFEPQPTFAQTGLWQPTEGWNPQNQQMVPGRMNERTGQFIPNSTTGGASALPKDVTAELGKELQTAREADKRLRIMEQNEAAALRGDQQAMLSLVASHIGMTLGAQKGARINQAVWNEAITSAPWLQNVQKRWGPDGYLQGVALSPEQVKQMVSLGEVVRNQQWKQVEDAFGNYGIPITSGSDAGSPPQENATGSPGNQPPKAGDTVDGYRFKGGDPNKQSNWEKVKQ